LQIEYLRAHGISIEKLPNVGKKCKSFCDGKIKIGKGDTKTIDSIITMHGEEYHATMKYTHGDGGGQTNQCENAETFIKEASICEGKFIALLDGDYYEKRRIDIYATNVYVLTCDLLVELSKLSKVDFEDKMEEYLPCVDTTKGKKKAPGQFNTTNYEYIFHGLTLPQNKDVLIIEPFAGMGDLVKYAEKAGRKVISFDIDPKVPGCIYKDTLLDTSYLDGGPYHIITNPPYLAKNKSRGEYKAIYDKYDVDDLYKAFVKILTISDAVLGGILIIPLNFLTAIDAKTVALRKQFFAKYEITALNLFEESVFVDTRYTVIAFSFERGRATAKIPVIVYPEGKKYIFDVDNDLAIHGAEMHSLPQSKAKFGRLIVNHDDNNATKIYLHLVDTGSVDGKIRAEIKAATAGKDTDRTFATLTCNIPLDDTTQNVLVVLFNMFVSAKREQYRSAFMNNNRESSTSYARKRMSFELAYSIMSHLYGRIYDAPYDFTLLPKNVDFNIGVEITQLRKQYPSDTNFYSAIHAYILRRENPILQFSPNEIKELNSMIESLALW